MECRVRGMTEESVRADERMRIADYLLGVSCRHWAEDVKDSLEEVAAAIRDGSYQAMAAETRK
jgi:hypothetical protein